MDPESWWSLLVLAVDSGFAVLSVIVSVRSWFVKLQGASPGTVVVLYGSLSTGEGQIAFAWAVADMPPIAHVDEDGPWD